MKFKYANPLLAAMIASIAGTAAADNHGCENCADSMTIVSWGGAYSASQNNAYHLPYQEMTGITVVNDESSAEAVAKLRAMNEANNVTWDLVDVVAADAMRLCDEGLAEVIDHDNDLAAAPDGTPASKDFGDLIVSECFIPQIVYSTTLAYRNDVEAWGGNSPDSACALFDQENFPGKRTLEKRPINNMEWALLCDGVPKAEIYDVLGTPEGVDQALAKLDTIKADTIWWSAAAEPPQLLADGEAVIGSSYNGRWFSAIEEQHQPISMLWDAQVFDLDGWIVPAGLSAERKDRVMHYLSFATDTQRLADQAKFISYGPARLSSAPMVSRSATIPDLTNLKVGDTVQGIPMGPHMPTDPENAKNTFLYNYEFWADNRDDIDAKFQAWLAK